MCFCSACGVAHQALESIDPKGDDILIQGEYSSSYTLCFPIAHVQN